MGKNKRCPFGFIRLATTAGALSTKAASVAICWRLTPNASDLLFHNARYPLFLFAFFLWAFFLRTVSWGCFLSTSIHHCIIRLLMVKSFCFFRKKKKKKKKKKKS